MPPADAANRFTCAELEICDKETNMDLKEKIRSIPDFPKEGILFRDITTLLKDAQALKQTVDELSQRYSGKPVDIIAGIESRGFILGTALAYQLGKGFV